MRGSIVLALSLICVLTACGGGGSNPQPTATPVPTVTPTSTPTPTTSPTATPEPTATPVPTATPANLVWSDEFNDTDGTQPDAVGRSFQWNFDIGGGGFGNNELETYTKRPENVTIKGGNLVITARKEDFTGPDNIARNYTSARLISLGKYSVKYGKIEARIKIPKGQGIWPAFWMLGDNINLPGSGWPTCGEIDIMENIGREPKINHGSLHGPTHNGGNSLTGSWTVPNGILADDFHVYGIEWEENVIRFYVDGNLYETRISADVPNGGPWSFNHPFFFIINVAVGGGWPGSPDASTIFPQEMLVDYVRVYSL